MVYVYMNSMLARAYKVTDELFDLSTMAMEYFKERIEPGLPEVTYLSSDFLVPKCKFHHDHVEHLWYGGIYYSLHIPWIFKELVWNYF